MTASRSATVSLSFVNVSRLPETRHLYTSGSDRPRRMWTRSLPAETTEPSNAPTVEVARWATPFFLTVSVQIVPAAIPYPCVRLTSALETVRVHRPTSCAGRERPSVAAANPCAAGMSTTAVTAAAERSNAIVRRRLPSMAGRAYARVAPGATNPLRLDNPETLDEGEERARERRRLRARAHVVP